MNFRIAASFIIALAVVPAAAENGGSHGDWRYHGGDFANTRYSPLDQINAENFKNLEVLWRWSSIETAVTSKDKTIRTGQFKATPLVAGGLMYIATSVCQIAALDPGTGETVWTFDPESYKAGRPANAGFQHRGVSYWADGKQARILIAAHDRKLWALDAKTGKPCEDFGSGGSVDLSGTLGRPVPANAITHSSPVGICRDTVIVGSIVFDGPRSKAMPPGHVRGYDVRTGAMKWIFHTIPQEGEFGIETWEDESWRYSGNTNVWAMFASDEELGYVYLPISTPTNDMYGGHRLGNNLFGDSIVCLDAETGKRVWHFQAVHHGLWDYDFPTGPNLLDVTRDGKPVKAIAQVSKQGFCYVFDRKTGEPLWPIEERPVPPSDVPGERASPTQPFPTKPAPFERQGFSDDVLIDFTPALREEALRLIQGYPRGPLFTPPSLKGTFGLPSPAGGANWPGAAVDPETGFLYVPSITTAGTFGVTEPDPSRSDLRYITNWFAAGAPRNVRGLPLVKPPYSRVTAIDIASGGHVWMTPHGDGPRNNPAIASLNLGPLGAPSSGLGSGLGPLVTRTLLFVTQGESVGSEADGKPKITVFNKKTGTRLGQIDLPAEPHGNPMTYLHKGRQYIALAIGGGPFMGGPARFPAELVALGLE